MARSPSTEYLVLDIETVPDTGRWTPEPTSDGRGPFPPAWAHRIIVIGCLWLDHGYALKRVGIVASEAGPGTIVAGEGATDDDRERALLEEFSRFVGRARPVLVTYNGRRFDLPVIALRALCHGVPLPWYYRERGVRYRFSEEAHLDLCDWLADHGAARAGSLDSLVRLIGLPGKVGVDGSQVEGLYQAGQLEAIQRYCLADVAQTALLLLRFRLLQGQLPQDRYRAAAAALLDALAADGRVPDVLAATDRARLLGPEPAATLST
nr:ribonuclease H-like domain-containing protein [Kofleriaceae bacterium]